MSTKPSEFYQNFNGIFSDLTLIPIPDNPAIHDGVVIWTGGCDCNKKPLIVFPVEMHTNIQMKKITDIQMTEAVFYYFQSLSSSYKDSGMAFLADFRAASAIIIETIIHTIKRFQFKNSNCPSIFYVIQPRDSNLNYLLKRRLNIPSSKSKQKVTQTSDSSNKIIEFKKVLIKKIEDLFEHVDPRHLTSDFGGQLQYCHKTWVMLKQQLSNYEKKLLLMKPLFSDIEENVRRLKSYKVMDDEDLHERNARIQNYFDDVFRKSNLDVLRKDAEILIEQLAPGTDRINGKYSPLDGNPHIQECQEMLTKTSTFLNYFKNYLLKTLSEIKTTLFLKEESKSINQFAHKEIVWIRKIGIPSLNIIPNVTSNVKDSELIARKFHNGTYTLGMMCISKCETILRNVAKTLNYEGEKTNSTPNLSEIQKTLSTFKADLQSRRKFYSDIYQYHLSLTKAENWLNKVIKALPVEVLEYDPTMNLDDAVQIDEVWRNKIHLLSLKYPPPKSSNVDVFERISDVIKDEDLKIEANMRIYRLDILRRLLTEENVTVKDIKELIVWKYQIAIDTNTDDFNDDISRQKINEKTPTKEFLSSWDLNDNLLKYKTSDSLNFIVQTNNRKDPMKSFGKFKARNEIEERITLSHSQPELRLPTNEGFHSNSYRQRALIEMAEKTVSESLRNAHLISDKDLRIRKRPNDEDELSLILNQLLYDIDSTSVNQSSNLSSRFD